MNTKTWVPAALFILLLASLTVSHLASTQAKGTEMAMSGVEQKDRDEASLTIEECVRVFSPDAATKTDRGWQFWFVPTEISPTFNFKVTQVSPQSANHPPHQHAEEEIYYVFEGKAEFYLNGKTKTVGPNSTMFCPSGVMHGIANVGASPLRYAVIKANYPAER
jgi:quercetin dioxygenase-like cupin family protein